MSKKILFNDEARAALKRGIDAVADAVKTTIGPRGRNVVLDKGFGGPTITNDGVSIAKEISLADKTENMGASIIKEVATKTNDSAGDGTTTATVLMQAIATEGMRHMGAGLEVMGIKRGIESATQAVVAELQKQAKKISSIDEIKQVATVSAESVELGMIIAETIDQVGQDGVVTVEESQGTEMTSEVVEGMSFDTGYASPYMVTDTERMEAVFENAPILVTDMKVTSVQSVLPILEKITATGRKDIVIIADSVEGEALATFVVNKLRGALNVLAIKAPGFGDRKKAMLEDIAVTVGAQVISEEKGMKIEDATVDMLGSAAKIITTKDETVVVDGKGEKATVTERIAQLKAQHENTKSTFDKEKIEERIAKLSGGVAVIRVGAATETEMKYLKLKIEDAVNATKAAIEEGVVAGGGSALVKAAHAVATAKTTFATKEEEIGFGIVVAACDAPLQHIAANSGKGDGSIVVAKIKELGAMAGYNSLTDEYVDDMVAAGIIDPVKVTRHALTNAASAAGTFLTTSVAIAEEPKDDAGPAMPPMGGMPGMGGF
jgi:chaperonin GroEL